MQIKNYTVGNKLEGEKEIENMLNKQKREYKKNLKDYITYLRKVQNFTKFLERRSF